MAEYRDQEFVDQVIDLDGNTFSGCTFIRCRIVFRAKASCSLSVCRFKENSQWFLGGPASGTMQFLSMLYQEGGETGREQVEQFFQKVRTGW